MLKNFRRIYDDELSNYDSDFMVRVLREAEVRMFVYEICKRCAQEEIERALQQGVEADGEKVARPTQCPKCKAPLIAGICENMLRLKLACS